MTGYWLLNADNLPVDVGAVSAYLGHVAAMAFCYNRTEVLGTVGGRHGRWRRRLGSETLLSHLRLPQECNLCLRFRRQALEWKYGRREIMNDPHPGRPSIYASAFFCDRLLREYDGVLSAIRVIDLFSVMVPEPGASSFVPRLETNLLVIFRSESPAEFVATIRATDPRGIVQSSNAPVTLTGEPGTYVYTMAITLFINGVLEGTHWYDILVDGSLVNRIPLHVRHTKVPTARELRQTWKAPDEAHS